MPAHSTAPARTRARAPAPLSLTLRLHGRCGSVDWQELAWLMRQAPLGTKTARQREAAFRASPVRCFAYHGKELVGVGRALTDGLTNSVIYDVAVLPAYQRAGVGRQVMDYLLQQLPRTAVLLVSVPVAQHFYRRCGFRRLRTAMMKRDFSRPGVPDHPAYFDPA